MEEEEFTGEDVTTRVYVFADIFTRQTIRFHGTPQTNTTVLLHINTNSYSIIRDYATERGETTINYASVEKTLLTKGFTQDQIDNCLEEYEAIDVWKINASRTQIAFVNAG